MDDLGRGAAPQTAAYSCLHYLFSQIKNTIERIAYQMVYVLNVNGVPLMPTDRHGKVRRLLKSKQARVVKRTPFTIQLLYDTPTCVQPLTLGVDAGSKHIGLSVSSENKEVYAGQIEPRQDVSKRLDERRQYRRSRRNRLRYRKPRFNNRTASKPKGWIAPSIACKIESHVAVIGQLHQILPITEIIVEVADFDTQKMLNPDIQGKEYQTGPLFNSNLRQYTFARDGYTCQWCKGKSKNKILHVHHWNYWRGDHTNKPSSVITLCDVCNDSKNHKKDGFLYGWEPKITNNLKDEAFMNISRWALYNRLKEIYPNVRLTYGYITKVVRSDHGIEKSHVNDALCIASHPNATRLPYCYLIKKNRVHNRQIHKANKLKGGKLVLSQAAHIVKGFRWNDKVLYNGKICFVTGRRTSGYFTIKTIDGTTIYSSVSYKKLTLLEKAKHYSIERIARN